MQRMPSRDAAYLFLGDRHDSATVVSAWVLREDADGVGVSDGDVLARLKNLTDLDDHFVSRVQFVPLSLGRPWWQRDPAYALARHYVRHEGGLTWAGAVRLIAEIGAHRLPVDRPLWRAHLLPGVTGVPGQSGSVTILAIMWHHAAFDGMRWTQLTRYALADPTDRGPAPPAWRVGDGARGRVTAAAADLALAPLTWSRFLGGLITGLWSRGRDGDGDGEQDFTPTCPPTRFTVAMRGSRVCSFVPLPLVDVLEVKRSCPGSTVNDVLLSVIGGALRQYLVDLGEPPESSLPALVPVSTRVDAGGPVNQFVASVVDMHTDIVDPLARVSAVSMSATAAKTRVRARRPQPTPELPGPLLRLLGSLSRSGRLNHAAPVATVAISNIGPSAGVDTLAGMPVDAMFGMQTLSPGCLLAHSIRTVRDRVLVSITTDDTVMPDPNTYLRLIEESMAGHTAAALR